MSGIPEGMSTVTPQMVVSNAKAALAIYEKALGAETQFIMEMPGTDLVMHASFKIGTSIMFISDEMPGGPRKAPVDGLASVAFYLHVDDVDAAYKTGIEGGFEGVSEPENMFWGDRTAVLHDPYGYNWTLATRVKEVGPEDMAEAIKNMASASETA